MCYSIRIRKRDLEEWMSRHPTDTPILTYIHQLSAFTFPTLPIIFPEKETKLAQWGLLPAWSRDRSYQKNTLNARIDTLHEKPSFRSYVNNRCILPVEGFYEWQWADPNNPKCKKQLFLVTGKEKSELSLASIYSDWVDKSTGEIIRTFSVVTTGANELMSEIHNSKKRMPVVLSADTLSEWLAGKPASDFDKPIIDLEAEAVLGNY